jgi:hypothetical protein
VAQGPICIITPTGMVCASSKPMKRHFPKPEAPVTSALADKVYDAVNNALKNDIADAQLRDVYATVCELMAQGGVTTRTPFTVTAAAN